MKLEFEPIPAHCKSNSKKIYFICMSVLPECIDMPCMHSWCLWKPQRMLEHLELDLQVVVS